MIKLKKTTIIAGALGLTLFTGSVSVYAGTIIERYKTPRGNIATVESENIHKNRVGITVNGKKLTNETWYANGVTYIPLREVSQILGASVNYTNSTLSADIVTESDILNLLGLKIGVPYFGTQGNNAIKFEITELNPSNNEFTGTWTYVNSGNTSIAKGKISENTLKFHYSNTSGTYQVNLTYYGGTKEYKGTESLAGDINGKASPVIISLD